jgi:hypothetical protein
MALRAFIKAGCGVSGAAAACKAQRKNEKSAFYGRRCWQ